VNLLRRESLFQAYLPRVHVHQYLCVAKQSIWATKHLPRATECHGALSELSRVSHSTYILPILCTWAFRFVGAPCSASSVSFLDNHEESHTVPQKKKQFGDQKIRYHHPPVKTDGSASESILPNSSLVQTNLQFRCADQQGQDQKHACFAIPKIAL
jgi:hypothetical protein